MSIEISEEEFLHFESILKDFQTFCRTLYEVDYGMPPSQEASPFSPASVYSKRRIWNVARAAWMEFRDEDPESLYNICREYLLSYSNPDPAQLAKDHSLND